MCLSLRYYDFLFYFTMLGQHFCKSMLHRVPDGHTIMHLGTQHRRPFGAYRKEKLISGTCKAKGDPNMTAVFPSHPPKEQSYQEGPEENWKCCTKAEISTN